MRRDRQIVASWTAAEALPLLAPDPALLDALLLAQTRYYRRRPVDLDLWWTILSVVPETIRDVNIDAPR